MVLLTVNSLKKFTYPRIGGSKLSLISRLVLINKLFLETMTLLWHFCRQIFFERLKESKMLKKNYDISFERSVIFFPGLRLSDFSAELLSNYDYLIKVFKDTGIETWENHTYERRSECTCRWSAQAIPFLYRMTCQWEISEVTPPPLSHDFPYCRNITVFVFELDSETLASISEHFKFNYHRGFMVIKA